MLDKPLGLRQIKMLTPIAVYTKAVFSFGGKYANFAVGSGADRQI